MILFDKSIRLSLTHSWYNAENIYCVAQIDFSYLLRKKIVRIFYVTICLIAPFEDAVHFYLPKAH